VLGTQLARLSPDPSSINFITPLARLHTHVLGPGGADEAIEEVVYIGWHQHRNAGEG
jgi:hypothetical protein